MFVRSVEVASAVPAAGTVPAHLSALLRCGKQTPAFHEKPHQIHFKSALKFLRP